MYRIIILYVIYYMYDLDDYFIKFILYYLDFSKQLHYLDFSSV